MSKADEMFKEIKFIKIKDDDNFIKYQHIINPFKTITFIKDRQHIKLNSLELLGKNRLQAINEKVKELGWLDE